MTEMIKELDRARDRAVDLATRLNPRTASVDDERELAEAMVDVRSHLRTRRGAVDWHARTGAAKSLSSEIYSAIDASPEDLTKLKGRMRQHFMRILETRAPVVHDEDEEDTFTADSFYDDLGIFISHLGRKSATETEAVQLTIAAGKLLGLIDEQTILEAGPVATATVLASLQAVSDVALGLHKRMTT